MQQDRQPPPQKIVLSQTALDIFTSWKQHTSWLARAAFVGGFYGMLLGCGVPATPILYKTFQSNLGAQLRIISEFTAVGFVCSAVPYALWVDNAKPGSSKWTPQFNSIFSPMQLGVCCWIGGHLWFPGNFVVVFEERGQKIREWLRLTAKMAIAFHRIHLTYLLGWSLFFGIVTRPFREAAATTKDEAVVVVAAIEDGAEKKKNVKS